MKDISHHRVMVAIETDATRYHGEHPSRPALLDRQRAEQMLAHLSVDLSTLIPALPGCALTMAGAVYDQTQLLRPGFPVFTSLENIYRSSARGQSFQPRLLSLGADKGRLPSEALQPDDSIPPGLLQLLPLTISAPAEQLAPVAAETEHAFLDQGQVSPQTATALQAEFGIIVNHARFMTVTDLNAMLRLQLEHFGFLGLWELLDAALQGLESPLSVKTERGHQFEWRNGAVHSAFESFDHWAQHGEGRGHPASGQVLAREYADWTREFRQYQATLTAHAIPLRQHLASAPAGELEGTFVIEESAFEAPGNAAGVTEHSYSDLGTIAVSVADADRLRHFYPLCPEGLNDLHRTIREAGLTASGISFPGTIKYDEKRRCLQAEALTV